MLEITGLFCFIFVLMFGPLKRLFENVKNLDSLEICVSVFGNKDIQSVILSKNRLDQLSQGLNADNEIIGVYSKYTDIMSEGSTFVFEGQSFEKIAGQPYNFIDSGEFFNSFRVLVYDDGFTIYANDSKEDGNLTDKFGKNILGLTDESKNELVNAMLPVFIEALRKEMLREVL